MGLPRPALPRRRIVRLLPPLLLKPLLVRSLLVLPLLVPSLLGLRCVVMLALISKAEVGSSYVLDMMLDVKDQFDF